LIWGKIACFAGTDYNIEKIALVAQRTEQQPSKLLVVGSNPAEGANMERNGHKHRYIPDMAVLMS
jgi:hypothetical protein